MNGDLAPGLLLEGRHPVDGRVGRPVLGVTGPGEPRQLALTGADRTGDGLPRSRGTDRRAGTPDLTSYSPWERPKQHWQGLTQDEERRGNQHQDFMLGHVKYEGALACRMKG